MNDIPQGVMFFLFIVAIVGLIIAVGIAGYANGQLDQLREQSDNEKEDEALTDV